MSIGPTPVASPRPPWSFGKMLSRAVVILIGIAAGCFIAIFVGLLNGWIEIHC